MRTEEMPRVPKFRSLIGPSFILLGLGLGSGEVILWPYLTSNFGMGIIWGAILGLTFQFFINMEIERYALARGESVFVGFAKLSKILPFWFIFSTFAGFAWPGIVAASAKLIGAVFGVEETYFIAILMLLLMGVILTLGPVLYKTMERFSMLLIGFGVPTIFALTLYLATKADWLALVKGVVGAGDGYNFLPSGIPIASFLAAFAFSGAGGNLNLAQSFYIKEKGYGMGKYSGRITSILTGKSEEIKLQGTSFALNKENLSRFKDWWKFVNIEHAIIFWGMGALAICFLSLLAYITTYGTATTLGGIDFVLHEAAAISSKVGPFAGQSFLVLGGLMLFSTQMTVLDATSRIMSENVLIIKKNLSPKSLPKIYYSLLWAQILVGIIIFTTNLREPLTLLIIEAVINAGAMFVHIGLTTLLNHKLLEKEIRISLIRLVIIISAFVFFGYLTFRTIFNI